MNKAPEPFPKALLRCFPTSFPLNHTTYNINVCTHLGRNTGTNFPIVFMLPFQNLGLFQSYSKLLTGFLIQLRRVSYLPLAWVSGITDLFVNSTSIELNQYKSAYKAIHEKPSSEAWNKYCSFCIQIFQQQRKGWLKKSQGPKKSHELTNISSLSPHFPHHLTISLTNLIP